MVTSAASGDSAEPSVSRRILQRLFPNNGSVHLLFCVSAAGRDALSQGDDYATR